MRFTTACAGVSTLAIGMALCGQASAQSAANPGAPNRGNREPTPATQNAPGAVRSTPPTASATQDETPEVVVTAQRRSQNLQDVPIVVTTVSKALLQDAGVKDIKDLAVLTPGLNVTSSTTEATTSARIRGIGTVGDNPGLESSVGVEIDGVYRPRNGVGFGDLGDVERIEVLKGPQGTLFGKNTSAGVINIITAAPSFKFGADAEFTAGNYGQYGGSGEVTGPIIADKLAGSLYFADRQRDGFFDVNRGAGPRNYTYDNNRDFYTVRGQLLAKPIENLTLRLIADYSHRTERCCIATETREGETNAIVDALAGGVGESAANPFARNAFSNRPDDQNITDGGVSLQADYRIPAINATLTSITAWRDFKFRGGFDADFSSADLFYLPTTDANSAEFRQISQELRLAGTIGKLDYIVGGFAAHEALRYNNSVLFGSQFNSYLSLLFSGGLNPRFLNGSPFNLFTPGGANVVNGNGSQDRYKQTDDSYAVFANATYHLTDKLEINGGIRYTDDEKRLDNSDFNIGGGSACAAATRVGQVYYALPANSPTKAALAPLVNSPIIPTLCLPFESPGFNGFTDHQAEGEQKVTGTAKVTYRFDPHILTYASYARGYKAGGFNLDRTQCIVGVDPGCLPGSLTAITPISNTQFAPEFVDSYELGQKSTLFNRKLLLNATLFYQKFTNFQLNTFNGFVFVVDSVPEITSKGLDTDFFWFPIHNLSFQGGLTIADTRYDLSGAELTSLQQRTGYLGSRGSRLSLAPLYSASFAGTYTYDINDNYKLRFNADFKFQSDYNTGSDLDPDKTQKDFWLMNARVTFAPRDDRWAVEFWVQNLFDRDYKQIAFDSGFQNAPSNATGVLDAFLGDPRTFGVTLRAHY